MKMSRFSSPAVFLLHDKQFSVSLANFFSSLCVFQCFNSAHLRASRQSRRCRKNSQKEQTRLSFDSILSLADFYLLFIARVYFTSCCENVPDSWRREQMRLVTRHLTLTDQRCLKISSFCTFSTRGDKSQVWNFLHFLLPHYTWLKLTTTKKLKFLLLFSLRINCGTTFQLDDLSTKFLAAQRGNFNLQQRRVVSSSHCRLGEHSSVLLSIETKLFN